jgi:hypothetical protein
LLTIDINLWKYTFSNFMMNGKVNYSLPHLKQAAKAYMLMIYEQF